MWVTFSMDLWVMLRSLGGLCSIGYEEIFKVGNQKFK